MYTLQGEGRGKLRFTISGDHFSAEPDTGKVSLVRELDRELVPEIQVVVTVQDENRIEAFPRTIRGKNTQGNSDTFVGSSGTMCQ